MKALASELAAAGKSLDDDELIGYLLHGLDHSYNALVAAVNANSGTSLADLFSQLSAYDLRQEPAEEPVQEFVSSANVARRVGGAPQRGRHDDHGRFDDRRGRQDDRGRDDRHGRQDSRGRGGDRGYRQDDRGYRQDDRCDRYDGYHGDDRRDRYDGDRRNGWRDRRQRGRDDRHRGHGRAPTPYVDVTCQIYKIHGHPASDCWWRYQDDNKSDDDGDKGANMASYGVDTNWYPDSGATNHITGELSKLSTHDKYSGRDRVHTANGNGMQITHIGHSTLRIPHNSLHLKNVLHVPSAAKNLISVP